jgi:DDE superfamily endonuclease
MLKERAQLHLTKSMIWRYLKLKLGMSYKIVKPISANHNLMVNKLKRQYASAEYIELLYKGKRIINIDETNVVSTDSRTRGWWFPKQKNQNTRSSRLCGVNIIIGISSYGEFFYTVNYGNTNTDTFFLFMLKLVQQLTSIDTNWRDNTVLLLDNASYHRSQAN